MVSAVLGSRVSPATEAWGEKGQDDRYEQGMPKWLGWMSAGVCAWGTQVQRAKVHRLRLPANDRGRGLLFEGTYLKLTLVRLRHQKASPPGRTYTLAFPAPHFASKLGEINGDAARHPVTVPLYVGRKSLVDTSRCRPEPEVPCSGTVWDLRPTGGKLIAGICHCGLGVGDGIVPQSAAIRCAKQRIEAAIFSAPSPTPPLPHCTNFPNILSMPTAGFGLCGFRW